MKYLQIPDDGQWHSVPFYFAVEEYVARHFSDDDYFFIWQVQPCVMVGRNQLIANEVNVDWCHAHGVAITRRKSGGGCIYSDEGCLLFSYIVSDHDATRVFEQKMRLTASTLEAAGIEVTLSGRNDILVDGRKVAGAAFYRCGERNVMHNSLLFSTQIEQMQQAITPSHSKLESKGVQSVSQRVGNVGDHTSLSIDEFRQLARRVVCSEQYRVLTPSDMAQIAQLEQYLASADFIYGSNPQYGIRHSRRIEGVGTMEAHIMLKNGIVNSISLTGDFFLLGDIDHDILSPLRGLRWERPVVEQALQGVNIGAVVRGLELTALLDLFFSPTPPLRKPAWLKPQSPTGPDYQATQHIIQQYHLHTICQSGRCPNRAECWRNRTATFMIGGDICTRRCRFCNTLTGRPLPLDPDEPARVAESIRLMGLQYAVITSVDRDDLPDLGAAHWAATIQQIHRVCPTTQVEVLIPDFQGRTECIDTVLHEHPDVVGHNMETTRRLTPSVRSVARYEQSLDVLRYVESQGVNSKTGFMLGLGESDEEVVQLLHDIRQTGCRRITIGQYLQPTHQHLPVERYYTPEEFAAWRKVALDMGFTHAVSGPLVRSSYHAADAPRQ